MSLFTFGSFRIEFRCLEKDLRPSDHISNDSKPCGRRDKDAGIIEISKHDDITEVAEIRKYESETRQDYVKHMNRSTRDARRNTLTLHSDGSEVSLNLCKALERLQLNGWLDIAKRSHY